MKSTEILKNAAAHIGDRTATYDKKAGERSIPATVAAFNAVTGHTLTAEQGWLFMALLKAVRSQQGAYRADSYEDGAAYFALAGEQAAVDRVSQATIEEVNLGEIGFPEELHHLVVRLKELDQEIQEHLKEDQATNFPEELRHLVEDPGDVEIDETFSDAERYRLLREYVVPRRLSRDLGIEWSDLKDGEGISDKIDALLDEALRQRR